MVRSAVSFPCHGCEAVLPAVLPTLDSDKHYDQFGFIVDEIDSSIPTCALSLNNNDKEEWITFFEKLYSKQSCNVSWDQRLFLPVSPELSEKVFTGIPHALRGAIWMRTSGALKKKANSELSYWEMLRFCDNDRICHARSIEKDLLRILPQNVCFKDLESEGIRRLRRVLRALSWYLPDVGYCQGMGLVVSYFVLFLEEEDAFWLMCTIIEDILPKLYYSESQQLLGVRIDFNVFCSLISNYLPDLNANFLNKNISLELIALQWFLTLFSGILPTYSLLRVWDLLFVHGNIVLFRIGIGILKLCESELENISSSSELFSYFSSKPLVLNDYSSLLMYAKTYIPSLNIQLVEMMRANATKLLITNASESLNAKIILNDNANMRNVQRTELLVNLRNAILRICKHFKEYDKNFYGDSVVSVDYSPESHLHDHSNFSQTLRFRFKRAKAIDDFFQKDSDELGFRKNDVITIISMQDPDCWLGQLDGVHGWFPSSLVRLIDERHKQYSAAGDNSVTPKISELITECLFPSLKAVFTYGLKRQIHPWHFIELAARSYIGQNVDSILSKILLFQAFRLYEDGKVLSPEELLFKLVVSLSCSSTSSDSKFMSFIYDGLNEQVLHLWLESLCLCLPVVEGFYETYSFLRSPAWIQIKCELRVLCQFSFTLQLNSDDSTPVDVMEAVRNLLIKHDLFSWEI